MSPKSRCIILISHLQVSLILVALWYICITRQWVPIGEIQVWFCMSIWKTLAIRPVFYSIWLIVALTVYYVRPGRGSLHWSKWCHICQIFKCILKNTLLCRLMEMYANWLFPDMNKIWVLAYSTREKYDHHVTDMDFVTATSAISCMIFNPVNLCYPTSLIFFVESSVKWTYVK